MIFTHGLVEKVLDGTKTVTRRHTHRDGRGHLVPCTYVEGRDYAIQDRRGGYALGRLRVLKVEFVTFTSKEPISWTDARLEGFASPTEFFERWKELHGPAYPLECWRIEFELLEP